MRRTGASRRGDTYTSHVARRLRKIMSQAWTLHRAFVILFIFTRLPATTTHGNSSLSFVLFHSHPFSFSSLFFFFYARKPATAMEFTNPRKNLKFFTTHFSGIFVMRCATMNDSRNPSLGCKQFLLRFRQAMLRATKYTGYACLRI